MTFLESESLDWSQQCDDQSVKVIKFKFGYFKQLKSIYWIYIEIFTLQIWYLKLKFYFFFLNELCLFLILRFKNF